MSSSEEWYEVIEHKDSILEPNKSRIIILKELDLVYSSEPYPLVNNDDFTVKSLYDLIEFS